MSLIDTKKIKKRKLTKKQIKTAQKLRDLEYKLGLNPTDEEGPSAADDYIRSLQKEEEQRREEWMLPGTFLPSDAFNFLLEDSPSVPEASPSVPDVPDTRNGPYLP